LSDDKDKFRIDTGQRLLRGLFYETTLADKTGVVYTLKDRDHMGYPSLYRLYMETDDPTEYLFATTHLESWDHWERLCKCSWFKPYLNRWRRELELRTRAKALLKIKTVSETDGKDSFQAHKFLVNGGWKPPEGSKRGRPSKDEIAQEANRIVSDKLSLDEDLARISEKLN
jgi:hypothetical protein